MTGTRPTITSGGSSRRIFSRDFLCALFGIGMTLFAWYGPWAWPAWPAFAAIHLFFGTRSWYSELSFSARSFVLVLLILLNVFVWAAIALAAWMVATRKGRRGTSP